MKKKTLSRRWELEGTSRNAGLGRPETNGDLFKTYQAGQLGHFSGQIDVWAVGQRTAAPGLLTGFVTVADLREMRANKTHWSEYKHQGWSVDGHCCDSNIGANFKQKIWRWYLWNNTNSTSYLLTFSLMQLGHLCQMREYIHSATVLHSYGIWRYFWGTSLKRYNYLLFLTPTSPHWGNRVVLYDITPSYGVCWLFTWLISLVAWVAFLMSGRSATVV